MPELPEVETVRRGLNKMIVGQKITAIDVLYDNIIVGDVATFKEQLVDTTIAYIGRRAKYLLFNFDNGLTMISHLRMEGKYQVRSEISDFDKHVYVIFHLSNGKYLGYRDVRKFGRMQLAATNDVTKVKSIALLGPEPLTPEFTYQSLLEGLKSTRKTIKAALLDQHVVSGLGNIYADEVLWLAKVHPKEPANELTTQQIKYLHNGINEVIKKAIKAGGTTIRSYVDATGHSGEFQLQLNVYGRQGQPCKRCETTIEKIKVANRGTHFCPQCQVLNS